MAIADLTAERLRHWVDYDPETGVFTRRIASKMMKAGDVAGSLHHQGYLFFNVESTVHAAHRLAWLYAYGKWPDGEIDHIDGDRSNNRLSNLRDVPHAHNVQNVRKPYRNNTSGILGVRRRGARWEARIQVEGRLRRLGLFDSPEAAHAAYLDEKRRLHSGCTI